LIETYNILTGKENVNRDTFFHLIDSERQPRGHSLKLHKRRCRLDTKKVLLLTESGQQLELTTRVCRRSSTHSRSGWTITTKIWAYSKADASTVHQPQVQVQVQVDLDKFSLVTRLVITNALGLLAYSQSIRRHSTG